MVIMKKGYILTFLLSFAFGIGLVLLAATSSMAVHKGSGDLTCGACHTMHSSQGSSDTLNGSSPSMGNQAGGSFILLRTSVDTRAELHNFCLQCHSESGAQAGIVNNGTVGAGLPGTTPPKVHLAGATPWDGASFATLGGGGLFLGSYAPGNYTQPSQDNALANDALGRQHSIGRSNVTPPGNSTGGTSIGVQIQALSCTSCHDPHGTNVTTNSINKYRNLKAGAAMTAIGAQNAWTDMASFGDLATSYVGGVTNTAGTADNSLGTNPTLPLNVWPVWSTTGTQNSYRTRPDAIAITLGGRAITTQDSGTQNVGFSAFCAQCHGAWHEATYATNTGNIMADGLDWKRHPVNNTLVSSTPNSGAGVAIVDFAHYNNTGAASSVAPYSTTNATKLPVANVADVAGVARYYADSSQDKVFCLTCHFSHGSIYNDLLRWDYTSAVQLGSQTGNTIASNVGCQQCHNR